MSKRYIPLIVIIITGAILIANYVQKSKQRLTYRISWFRLKVSPPDLFSFLASPQQPVLTDIPPTGNEPGIGLIVDQKRNPEGYDMIYDKLDALVTRLHIMDLPQRDPEKSYSRQESDNSTVQLQLGYPNGKEWASVYSAEEVPAPVAELIESCRQLAREIYAWGATGELSGEQARSILIQAAEDRETDNFNVILKVRLKVNGDILLNEKPAEWNELMAALDELKLARGVVWYSREFPEVEPGVELYNKMEAVINEIKSRDLYIMLGKY